MTWIKEIGPKGGGDGGWRDDLPLHHELPDELEIDCSRLRLPIQPMFSVRVRVFVDWHTEQGRDVQITPPTDPEARRIFEAMAIDPGKAVEHEDDAIVPVTRLAEFDDVESVAARTQEIIEYQLPDVSLLGQATFMAVSELCGNAIDHGHNDLGAYAAVMRFSEPRKKVSIAISDLGLGVPEHIRQRYPEWSDDGWAIGTRRRGTRHRHQRPHRGFGYSSVFEAALTNSLHAAQMDLLSANGFCRVQIVQEKRKVEVFPATRFRRGTWIAYDLISV